MIFKVNADRDKPCKSGGKPVKNRGIITSPEIT